MNPHSALPLIVAYLSNRKFAASACLARAVRARKCLRLGSFFSHFFPLVLILGTAGNSLAASVPSIVRVSAGSGFSVALDSKGGVWAWGNNSSGQLGDNTTVHRLTPVRVVDPLDRTGFLTHVIAIAAGGHAIVLKDNGTVWAWGGNQVGELGDGTQITRLAPVQVRDPADPTGFLQRIIGISAGGGFSLFLKSDHTVRSVGINDQGQLGDGTFISPRLTVVGVVDPGGPTGFLTGVGSVSAGSLFSVALKTDGTVRAWGRNTVGQLGDGTMNGPSPMPVRVKDLGDPTGNLTGVTAVAAGLSSSLALKTNGTIRAWGFNSNGQLGDGTLVNRSTATAVQGLSQVVSLDAGALFGLAVRSDSTVWTWGANSNGQLGDGTTTDRLTPVQLIDSRQSRGFRGAASVSGGSTYALLVTDAGDMWSWGSKAGGQLGNGTNVIRAFPVHVVEADGTALMGIDAISAGSGVSMGHTSSQTIRAWGANAFGQLGDGTTGSTYFPRYVLDPPVGLLTAVTAVNTGGSHTLAVLADGSVRAWGLGTSGQLGDGLVSNSVVPVQPSGLAGASEVSAGALHSLARIGDGTVRAWGGNSVGQLGDGTIINRPTPVQVEDPADASGFLVDVSAIAAGPTHSLALISDGTVRAWGQNNTGQLGDGSPINKLTPIQVRDLNDPSGLLTDVKAISAGGGFSVALKGDGTVRAWGLNTLGQLGDGTTLTQTTAQQVIDPDDSTGKLRDVVAISAGGSHASAVKSDGTIRTWGNNSSGQLGDGTTESRLTPATVVGPTGTITGVIAVSAGGAHTLALTVTGAVRAWGSHADGQIGDGTTPNALTPVKVIFRN